VTTPHAPFVAGTWTRAERARLSGTAGIITAPVAAFIGSGYLADIVVRYAGVDVLTPYASLADHAEYPGYGIVAVFVACWLTAAALWRAGRLERRDGGRP
jgi:hypothetical protein